MFSFFVMFAEITASIMKGRPAGVAFAVPDTAATTVFGRSFFLFSKPIILIFQRNTQGPPSWITRCIDDNSVYISQNAAAIAKGVPANELSQHLNGLRDHVRGYHFERLALAQ